MTIVMKTYARLECDLPQAKLNGETKRTNFLTQKNVADGCFEMQGPDVALVASEDGMDLMGDFGSETNGCRKPMDGS